MNQDQVTPFNYGDFLIRVVTLENGEPGFVAKDVANVLEIRNVSQMTDQLDDDEKRLSGIFTNGGPQKLLTVTKKGLKRLLGKTRSHHAKKFATRLGFHESIITTSEQDTIETIINAISGIINYKTQYHVKGYRVDLYLPEINIVIECDEHDHANRDFEYEREREERIIRTLNCKILRFNPHAPCFNIGNVINKILKLICFHVKTDDISNQKQPVPCTEAPKNYRGWNLNKRGKDKNGNTLFNLVRKVNGKKQQKYLGVWDQKKADRIIDKMEQEEKE